MSFMCFQFARGSIRLRAKSHPTLTSKISHSVRVTISHSYRLLALSRDIGKCIAYKPYLSFSLRIASRLSCLSRPLPSRTQNRRNFTSDFSRRRFPARVDYAPCASCPPRIEIVVNLDRSEPRPDRAIINAPPNS